MVRLLVIVIMVTLIWPFPVQAAPQPAINARPGELIVGLHPATTLALNGDTFGTHAASLRAHLNTLRVGVALPIGGGAYRLRLPDDADLPAAAALLESHPAVRYAELNYIRRAFRQPNDPLVNRQWALPTIRAFDAWEITTGNPVTVAVLDTGVAVNHRDLAGRLTAGFDFHNVDDDPSDDDGHGTFMAGIIAANANNNEGIAGVCWFCQIMPIKVLDRQGQGDDATIAAGLRWATDQGARVISMSLGGPEDTRVIREAVEYAAARNVLIVAASGNGGDDDNLVNYPAAYPSVLAVTATDEQDRLARFSTTGDFVDLAAPGVRVWSTAWQSQLGDTYGSASGTSVACPHVAAAAALLMSIRPDLNAQQIGDLLRTTADDLGPPGVDAGFGYGRLNLLRAVQAAINPTAIITPPTSPIPSSPFAPAPPLADARYFAETGHNLRGAFREFWERYGGLAIFGFPLSEEFQEAGDDGQIYVVQYFQRHRFEFHPENAPPYNVQIARMGDAVLQQNGRNWFTFPGGTPQSGCLFFEQTGHSLCGAFLQYWQSHGLEFDGRRGFSAAESLALFGMPISEPQTEVLSDGRSYTVQWFERARFEDHGANGVLLGLLGDELTRLRGLR